METDSIPKPEGVEKPFHNIVGKKVFLLVTVMLAAVSSSKT